MANRDVHKRIFIKAALLVVVGVLTVTMPIAAGPLLVPPPIQAPGPTPQTPANDRFEVVSIRVAEPEPILPGARGAGPGGVRPCGDPRQLTLTPGRFAVRGYSVFQLIAWAYGKDCNTAGSAELITGWPDWTLKQGFDIQATLPAGTPAYAPRQLQRGEAPRLQAMLRNMLAERFHLTLHRDSKDAPIYNVTFASAGKITLSNDQVSPSLENTPPPTAPPGPPGFSGPLVRGALTINVDGTKGRINASAISIATLLRLVSVQDGRLVVDKTGMKGLYDIPNVEIDYGLEIRPDQLWVEALKQLGFKFEPGRGPVEILVVDRLERPTEN